MKSTPTAAERRRHELNRLFKETVSLYWRLTADASRIHGRGDVSGPRRTILLALAEAGPQTVSRLARARGQARQRIQPLMNALIRDGLVLAAANPMHKQSPLMTLTAAGLAHVEDIRSREGALLERLQMTVSAARLHEAASVLEAVRITLEQQLPALVAESLSRRRRRRGR
jgi:DNA-binding MarR family transcriptional regulator